MKISLPKCPESAPKCFFSKPIFNQKELLYQLLLLHRALCPVIRLSKSGFIVELGQRMSQWQPDEIVVLKFWDRGSTCTKQRSVGKKTYFERNIVDDYYFYNCV